PFRQQYQREPILKQFTTSVESYLVHRILRLEPDEDDLWRVLQTLETAPPEQLSALEQSLVDKLARLRDLAAPEDDLQLAVLLAADLTQTRAKSVKYSAQLKQLSADYLQEQQPGASMAALIARWEAADPAALSARQVEILGHKRLLGKLGYDPERIVALIAEAEQRAD
ncbi:MAG: hypothetical protein JW910_09695, partial [Anaerolineae bacterium]|nr:hypothetical protein [Anaerolineae bacterium]